MVKLTSQGVLQSLCAHKVCHRQDVARSVWSIARLGLLDMPFWDAIASQARVLLFEFTTQGLTNIAWSFAILAYSDGPLMAAIARQSISRMHLSHHCSPRELAGLAWSFAHLVVPDPPLISAIAAAARHPKSTMEQWSMGDASALAWAFWRFSQVDVLRSSSCNQWSSGTWALEVDRCWSRCTAEEDGTIFSQQGREWMGAPAQAAKLLQLDARLKKAAQKMEPEGDRVSCQLADVEGFGAERAKWLKVAAGAKADVLAASLRGRVLADTEIVLELGGFVGYSANRLATSGTSLSPRRVVSMEKNQGCALLANEALSRAGLANTAEVWTGRASDLLPRVLEEYGEGSVGFAFFDHSGSAYLDDLMILEQHRLLGKNAVIVADNVLKPGAPLFLWHVIHGGKYDVILVSVPEFVQTAIEDWVAVCVWRGERNQTNQKHLDEASSQELSRLAWQSDAMRRRSERSGVNVATWAMYSQEMRLRYQRLGFEARPWQEVVRP